MGMGHRMFLLRANGVLDEEVVDVLRRNAFNADGAIVIDGISSKIIAAGWFVDNISAGGKVGGARSRSASSIAQQADYCYVIKCSEDSRSELVLHLGDQKV